MMAVLLGVIAFDTGQYLEYKVSLFCLRAFAVAAFVARLALIYLDAVCG